MDSGLISGVKIATIKGDGRMGSNLGRVSIKIILARGKAFGQMGIV
jgi:hypothetical protein